MVRVETGEGNVVVFKWWACEDILSDVCVADKILACATKEDRRGLRRECTLLRYLWAIEVYQYSSDRVKSERTLIVQRF